MAVPSIDVWAFRPAGGIVPSPELPEEAERRRQATFATPELAAAFAWRRWRLRETLAAYAGGPAEGLRFAQGDGGKPRLAGDAGAITFNTGYTDGLLVIAVAREIEVGIDVESQRLLDNPLALARRFFSLGEADALAAVAPEDRDRAALRCWVRKEALMKAHGAGLSFGLGAVDVGFAPMDDAGFGTEIDGRRFLARDLDLGGSHLAALAAEAPAFDIDYRSGT